MTQNRLYHLIKLTEGQRAYEAPSATRRFTPHVELTIAIGKDHSATLTMSCEAFAEMSRLAKRAGRAGDLSFGEAIAAMQQDRHVQREGWNGKGMWLWLVRPASKHISLPYIAMYTATGDTVPWLASQTDMLASDWRIVE